MERRRFARFAVAAVLRWRSQKEKASALARREALTTGEMSLRLNLEVPPAEAPVLACSAAPFGPWWDGRLWIGIM